MRYSGGMSSARPLTASVTQGERPAPPRYRQSGEGRNPAAPKATCSRTSAPDSFALPRAAGFRASV